MDNGYACEPIPHPPEQVFYSFGAGALQPNARQSLSWIPATPLPGGDLGCTAKEGPVGTPWPFFLQVPESGPSCGSQPHACPTFRTASPALVY